MIQFPGGRNLHFLRLSYPNSPGDCLHPHTLSVTYRKFTILKNGVQFYNIHIPDTFPLLYSVRCFGGFGSTPYKASLLLMGENLT